MLRFFYWNDIIKKQSKPRNKLQFEVHLTEHCNLNCKGCCHFSPIAETEFLNCTVFEQDCRRLYDLTRCHVDKIHLMGGEPLLHPKLTEIMDIASKYFDTGIIEIVTNGILLLKQSKKFWECCRKNKVTIIITNYPINRDDNTIKQMAEKYHVHLEYWGGDIKTFDCIPLDLSGSQDCEKSFKSCRTKNLCIQLKDGKLYTCHTAAYITHFNRYFRTNIQLDKNDYVDIYKAKNLHEILNFLSKPIPLCNYCNTTNPISGLKWDTSNKQITEWI
ncbi:MAG: radical SAM protein [Bacteroidales bacterium]|nr:radical SAM protein [Bacteroidales bacterium]